MLKRRCEALTRAKRARLARRHSGNSYGDEQQAPAPAVASEPEPQPAEQALAPIEQPAAASEPAQQSSGYRVKRGAQNSYGDESGKSAIVRAARAALVRDRSPIAKPFSGWRATKHANWPITENEKNLNLKNAKLVELLSRWRSKKLYHKLFLAAPAAAETAAAAPAAETPAAAASTAAAESSATPETLAAPVAPAAAAEQPTAFGPGGGDSAATGGAPVGGQRSHFSPYFRF